MRPVLFYIDSIPIWSYGTCIALGMITLFTLALMSARRVGRSWEQLWPMVMGVLVGGAFGARLSHLIVEPDKFAELIDFYGLFRPGTPGNIVGLKIKRPAPADGWRRVKHVVLLVVLFAALLTNLTLLVLDPLTLLFRTLSTSVWPAVDQLVTAAETALYRGVPFLRPAVSAFDRVVRPVVLPADPAFYRFTALYAAVFLGVVALNAVASRFWCRYLCPLGALLGLLSKVGLVRWQVNDRCYECGACARVCPTGTIRADKEYKSDPAECIMCLECQEGRHDR